MIHVTIILKFNFIFNCFRNYFHIVTFFLPISLGPVATGLAARFSVKSVTFIGGLLLFSGICIAGVGPSVEFMFFPISFLAGLLISL